MTVSAFYPYSAAVYDQTLGAERAAEIRDAFDRVTVGRPIGHFLDVGCGTGALVEHATRRGWRAFGVEPSEAMRAAMQAARPTLPVPFPAMAHVTANAWDVVAVLGDVMNYMADQQGLDRVVRALREVIPAGGMLWGDATTVFDISRHWQDCRNVYTAPGQFQLIVEHAPSRHDPGRGIMTRRLMTPVHSAPDAWVERAVERDEVLGLSPTDLQTTLQRYFESVTLFDWETDGSETAQSSRIGYVAIA